MTTSTNNPTVAPGAPQWARMLNEAITRRGLVHAAYSRFWNYSIGNQVLAALQCAARGIDPGPIHTFSGWRALGRFVRKGERAIELCMPVTVRRKSADKSVGSPDTEVERAPDGEAFTRFVYRNHWFVLCQTDGLPYMPEPIPSWDEPRALSVIQVQRVPFCHTDGNCQGYARGRTVAVSPLAFNPHRTLLHEVAHVVLGHTAEAGTAGLTDTDEQTIPRNLMEVEAEAAAYLCCESLGLTGGEYSRGYLQHWLRGRNEIPERSAQRAFKAANQILRAGRVATGSGDEWPDRPPGKTLCEPAACPEGTYHPANFPVEFAMGFLGSGIPFRIFFPGPPARFFRALFRLRCPQHESGPVFRDRCIAPR